jgi:hypothetical protein
MEAALFSFVTIILFKKRNQQKIVSMFIYLTCPAAAPSAGRPCAMHTPSTIQKFRIISLVSGGLSMGQIALWKPFQFFLLGISPSVVHFSVFNILQ